MATHDPLETSRLITLIPCEWRVLLIIAEDQSTTEIASVLCLSKKTIETYQTRIGEKLGLSGSRKLATFARKNRQILIDKHKKICQYK